MVYPQEVFRTALPEEQGVSSRALIDMLNQIRESGKDLHSMLVLRHGYLVNETYFAPYTARTVHSMFSCSKTFTSMLIGIACGKGLLRLTDTVASFFPDKLPDAPSDNLLRMTVRDLLIMGTGNDQDTFGYLYESDGDWVKAFLARPVEHTPGTFFRYNTGATYMLSAILTHLTGKTALELAEEWIFSKIGIRGARWDACPKGISLGGTGLHITPLDMARFGLLLLGEGAWDGEQVVPAEYVREAREKQIDTSNHIAHPDWTAGYCYQMWRCSFGAFRADGMGGQFIVILPKYDAVVVFTSALGSDISYPLDVLSSHLDALFREEPMPADEAAVGELRALSAQCRKPSPQPMSEAAKACVPWGKRIKLASPLMDIVSAFTLYEDRMHVETKAGDGALYFRWEAPELAFMDVKLPMFDKPVQLSLAAYWREGLLLRGNALGEPFTLRVRMTFDQGKALLTPSITCGPEMQPIEGVYA